MSMSVWEKGDDVGRAQALRGTAILKIRAARSCAHDKHEEEESKLDDVGELGVSKD